MILNLFIIFKLVKSDFSKDLFLALENQKLGKIVETQNFFETNLEKYGEKSIFITKYIEFLLSIGEYEKILKKYGHLNLEIVNKTKEYLSIVTANNYKKIAELLEISKYSPIVLKSSIKLNLINYEFYTAENLLRRSVSIYSEDIDFKKLYAQFYCLSGNFDAGIQTLSDLGFEKTATEVKFFVNEITNFKSMSNTKNKQMHLKQIYNNINTKSLSDYFTPSVFITLKYQILYEYLKVSVYLESPDISSLSQTYLKYKNDEESKYFYVISFVFNGNLERAKKELEAANFTNLKYKRIIQEKLESRSKSSEKKRKYDEENNKRQIPQTSQAGQDFLGYYKLLGVKRNATPKEVRKAYTKIIAKNKKKRKNPKLKDKWEKEHMQYNKAVEVLSSEKKKNLYDNGIDPDSPYPQYQDQHHHRGHKQYYSYGQDFGGFEDFFNSFAGFGQRGFGRSGRQTQYVFFQ